MSDLELLAEIHRMQLAQGATLHEMRGEQRAQAQATNDHLRQIDARLDIGSSTIHRQGEAIVRLEQQVDAVHTRVTTSESEARTRRRHCSELFKRLGGKLEDTGVHVIEQRTEQGARAKFWRQMLAALGLCVSLAGALGLGGYLQRRAASGPHQQIQQQPAARDAAVIRR